MLTYIKKDLLLFWRNRRETATVVLLPIILIVVLNFAFSGLFGTDSKPLALALAVVNEDREPSGKEQLLAYLQNPGLSEWLTVKELDEFEALEQVEQGEVDGAIKIPDGYSSQLLSAGTFNEGTAVELPLIVKENSMHVEVVQQILGEYFGAIHFGLALQQAAGAEPGAEPLAVGGREMIEGAEPFSMGQYFTIGMGLLFALFIAASVAERTGTEKREQVFNRIVVTNTRPLAFLMGKTFSTFCLVWLQIVFVILVSQLLLGVFSGKSTDFWLGLLLMLTAYAMTMAGLTALYTSISLRVRNIDASNAIFMLLTMVFGILGGNFFPNFLFPPLLQRIGEWTPNGLTLAVVTEWIQYGEFGALWGPLSVLTVFAAICILAGAALYPKRGEV